MSKIYINWSTSRHLFYVWQTQLWRWSE